MIDISKLTHMYIVMEYGGCDLRKVLNSASKNPMNE